MKEGASEVEGAEERGERPPRRRRVARFLLRLLVVFVFFEVALRVGVYFVKGGDPYYLFYGFQGAVSQAHVSPWSVWSGQYYKFPPGYELQGAAGQKHETAHVNAQGFRGSDFEPKKPAGVFRIVSLGGSSTFGFHNNDDETYPYLLQERFREDGRYPHVEVLNAGFPYYNTATIRGLFENELLAIEPDVITLYCGYNDASWPLGLGLVSRAVTWLQEHSITVYVLKETVLTDKNYYKLLARLRRYTGSEEGSDPAVVQAEVDRVAERMMANVEAIAKTCEERGIQLVLIRQPITIRHENPLLGDLTYEEEYQAVAKRLEERQLLTEWEERMICHHRLVQELDAMAARRGMPVVDNIALLDEDRSRLASWVHLVPEANRRLADALFETIAPLVDARGD